MVVHEDAAGEVYGFARYSIVAEWGHGHPDHLLLLEDLVGATANAQEALWRMLLGIDLVGTIEFAWFDAADPMPAQLVDQRVVRVVDQRDGLWVCPLDVGAALAGRGYAGTGRVVLDVDGTRLAVAAGPDGAEVAVVDGGPDLVLTAADLGALLLGGVRATALVRARRAGEAAPGGAAAGDRLFATDPPPHLATGF